jgi:hypothetical protein
MFDNVHHIKRHVSQNEYMEKVSVDFSPPAPKDGAECTDNVLPGDTAFVLRTRGMHQFGRPELTLRDIPALWLAAAGDFINNWALYTINEREFKPGETLTGGLDHTVLLHVTRAEDDDDSVLLLTPTAMRFKCAHCGTP